MSKEPADLQIELRRDAADVQATLTFTPPRSDAAVDLGTGPVRIDPVRLRALEGDSRAYGVALAEQFFENPAVRNGWTKARSAAKAMGCPLRVRLLIRDTAAELHENRWERMLDPESGDFVSIGVDEVYFSRYVPSGDMRPVQSRATDEYRALVAIVDYAGTGLPETGLDEERQRAGAALEGIEQYDLSSEKPVTLGHLTAELRKGYDILYLACHGAVVDGEARLWLAPDPNLAGSMAKGLTPAAELNSRMQALSHRPRLVLLASCQSAGGGRLGDPRELAQAIGPMLARSGIPAVLAMQGDVSVGTVRVFVQTFFASLRSTGIIDAAAAAARAAVRGNPDWWMPVLYLRLQSGRIHWYSPGFQQQEDEEARLWDTLLLNLENKAVTPVLGPGLTEPIIGSRREIARELAQGSGFPMAPHQRESLPSVAQFIETTKARAFLEQKLTRELLEEVRSQYASELDERAKDTDLLTLISLIGEKRWERDPADPFRVFAELELPVYVTSDTTDLLSDALRRAGREPVVEICRWSPSLFAIESEFDTNPDFEPTPERPLVYHLLGHLRYSDSLVLTEDDYFEYLISVTEHQSRIPKPVQNAFNRNGLLFLGFQLEEWDFRILYRLIRRKERPSRQRHVAAQVDPEEGRLIAPAKAREYMIELFENDKVSVYSGTVESFVKTLTEKAGQPQP